MHKEAIVNLVAVKTCAKHYSLQSQYWEVEMLRAEVEYNLRQQALGGLWEVIQNSGLAVDTSSIHSADEEQEEPLF